MQRLTKRLTTSFMLRLNIIVCAVLMLTFATTTVWLSARISREQEERDARTLEAFCERFTSEANQIRDQFYLCRANPAFIMITGSRLEDWTELREYLNGSMKILEIMHSSIPASIRTLLYSSSVNRLIGQLGYTSDDGIRTQFEALLAPDEQVPVLSELTDGWHTYQNFALYALNVYGNGCMIEMVNPRLMGGLDGFSDSYPGQTMLVLLADGSLFSAGSLSLDTKFHGYDFSGALAESRLSLPGVGTWSVLSRRTESFQFLLLTDVNVSSAAKRTVNALTAASIGAAALLLILLLAYNSFFSRSLRHVLHGVGVDKREDELAFIRAALEENSRWRGEKLDIALNYVARVPGERTPDSLCRLIWEAFDHFFVARYALALPDGPVSEAEHRRFVNYVLDHGHCHAVSFDEYGGFLVLDAELRASLEPMLAAYFADAGEEFRALIGLSDMLDDTRAVKLAFDQAGRRMRTARLTRRALSICDADDGAAWTPSAATIAQMARTFLQGETQSLAELLELALVADPKLRLCDLRALTEALIAALIRQRPDLDGLLASLRLMEIYHPESVLRALLSACHMVAEQTRAQDASGSLLQREVVEYIDAHYMEELSLESVAHKFRITPVYLSRWFKQKTEVNFSAYLQGVRMAQARRLIEENPALRNVDVAAQVGIANAQTFVRQFKVGVGMTPEQYRKTYAEGAQSTEEAQLTDEA